MKKLFATACLVGRVAIATAETEVLGLNYGFVIGNLKVDFEVWNFAQRNGYIQPLLPI